MRVWWSVIVYAAFAAGGAFVSGELTPMAEITIDAGSSLPMQVRTLPDIVEGCFLVPPNGEPIQLMPEDLSGDKYEVLPPAGLYGCRVDIITVDEDNNGVWELFYTIADETKRGSQYYNVKVISQEPPSAIPNLDEEEAVNAVPRIVTIAEGSDLHVRLENSTILYDTCVLTGPVRSNADLDENFIDTCGFIVRDVSLADTGDWEIEYGTETKYRATIHVTVTVRFQADENSELVWTKNMPLNETIGPEDAVYCRIENPFGLIVTEGFGPCNIVLDRVRSEHAGVWKTYVSTVGRVLVDTHEYIVKVKTATKAEVITSTISEKPSVMLSCRVNIDEEVTACKFRDPSGKILLASQGVGEDRYSFHGVEVGLNSEVSHRECGLRIMDPVVADLGLWRCAMETEEETYYGFLTVLCPWAMMDPNVAAAVVSEPTLTSDTAVIKAVEGHTVTMRCSVQSAIRYCYFRARNGTIFNVSPGTLDWYEYAGAGLDAGECSIRFPGLQAGDSGSWSCHVGLYNPSEPEQRVQMAVTVEAEMLAEQYHNQYGNQEVLRGQVAGQRALEYCRFVRIDGEGFTTENLPSGYENHSDLSKGLCEITRRDPTILDRHPWTVVAKIVDQDSEVSRSTQHTLTVPEGQPEPEGSDNHRPKGSGFMLVWLFVLVLSLTLFCVGVMLGPKKNRDWTRRRAASVRNSFRTSILKKPLPAEQNAQESQRTPASV